MRQTVDERNIFGGVSTRTSQHFAASAPQPHALVYRSIQGPTAQGSTLEVLAEQLGELEAKLEEAKRRRNWVERENIEIRTNIRGGAHRSLSPALLKKVRLIEILREHNKDLQTELDDVRRPQLSPGRLAVAIGRQRDLMLKLGAANARLARQVKESKVSR